MYQSFSRMNTSLVAEHLCFKPLYRFNVATHRINKATYPYFVTTLLFDATVKRMILAMQAYFVASN